MTYALCTYLSTLETDTLNLLFHVHLAHIILITWREVYRADVGMLVADKMDNLARLKCPIMKLLCMTKEPLEPSCLGL